MIRAAAVAAALAIIACDAGASRPSPELCRQAGEHDLAIAHVPVVLAEPIADPVEHARAVRAENERVIAEFIPNCVAHYTKAQTECMIAAPTLKELEACLR